MINIRTNPSLRVCINVSIKMTINVWRLVLVELSFISFVTMLFVGKELIRWKNKDWKYLNKLLRRFWAQMKWQRNGENCEYEIRSLSSLSDILWVTGFRNLRCVSYTEYGEETRNSYRNNLQKRTKKKKYSTEMLLKVWRYDKVIVQWLSC